MGSQMRAAPSTMSSGGWKPCSSTLRAATATCRRYSAGLPLDNQHLDNPDDAQVWQLMAHTPLEYLPGSAVL